MQDIDIYISSGEVILRLFISLLIGGIIGYEREKATRPAGFRTHILVTIGSCVVMMISATAFNPIGHGNDPTRMAAQVVTGIGFLGAGTILRDGNSIAGLTTAASLWTCGCIGLAIGSGLYLIGISAALFVIITLSILGRANSVNADDLFYKVILTRDLNFGNADDIKSIFENNKISLLQTIINEASQNNENKKLVGKFCFRIQIGNDNLAIQNLLKDIIELPGVIEAKIENDNNLF